MDMPETSYMHHDELKKLMKWKLVTNDIVPIYEPCPGEDCSCNRGFAEEGEMCSVTGGLVQQALGKIWAEAADKMLFKALVRAAIAAPEGCVVEIWRQVHSIQQ